MYEKWKKDSPVQQLTPGDYVKFKPPILYIHLQDGTTYGLDFYFNEEVEGEVIPLQRWEEFPKSVTVSVEILRSANGCLVREFFIESERISEVNYKV